ncbi:DUF6907 domain-containing protein [Streptomyces sp. NPDC093221]|uniref:DUF6907 domain-containing protein n=1 Tax=Streptomyces sp. NPDC093221 TaxID=3366032 RepID=UPI0037FCA516
MTATSVAQSPAIVAPLIQQPPAALTPPGRTWSISTTGGFTLTGYLPPWADEDPSDTDVPLERLSVTLIDLAHRRPFAGQRMRVHHPARAGDDGQADESEESLFDGHITCYPYSEEPRERAPHANVRVVEDFWLNNLTPEDLTDLAARLRAQADRLETELVPVLEEARNDWFTAHEEPAGTAIPSRPIGTFRR